MSPLVDADRFPLVRVRFEGGSDMQQVLDVIASYQELAQRRQRMAMVVDLRRYDAASSDAAIRKRCAKVYNDAAAGLRGIVVGEARIVSGAIARYVLTAFDWLTGTPWPTATFTSDADAERWARRQLGEEPARFSAAAV